MIYKDKPTKDGRAYYFRLKYRDIYGKIVNYRSGKYLTKKEAQREEASYRLKASGSKETASTITFDMAFNEYMLTHSKEIKKQSVSKIYDKYKALDPIKDIKINSFTLEKYQQFIKYLRGLNYSTSYSNKILNLLKRIIVYSNVYHNTSTDILRFIEHIKAPEEFKREMRTSGRKGAKMTRVNLALKPENYDYVKTMSFITGMTYSEFINRILDGHKATHGDLYQRALDIRNEI